MIESVVVKIEKVNDFDNIYIERELSKMFNNIVRWAIIDIDESISVSVSYEK